MDSATTKEAVTISVEKLLVSVQALVSGLRRGREDDEHPLPPGPWDPVVRAALERLAANTPAWRQAFDDEVALNPQPLPPRLAFLVSLAHTFAGRAALLEEFAGAASQGEPQGIIIVSGYIDRFADEWCGNGFRLKWPLPGPRPNWFATELDGLDFLVLAAGFEQAARQSFSEELRESLRRAGARFTQAGLARMA